MLFLGIDIGTTNCKLSLYNERGDNMDDLSFSTPVINPQKGFVEYDVNTLWKSLSDNIKKISEPNQRGKCIASIAISSQGETGLLVDEHNNPLTNAIAWYDRRTEPLAKKWSNSNENNVIYQITGLKPDYIYSIFKIKWLQKYQPQIFKKASKWHCLSDYFARKLSGVIAMDFSLASRTMAFNIREKKWSNKIFSKFELPIDIMPHTCPSLSPLGKIKNNLADRLNLSKKTLVVAGGFDHLCGAFGLLANQENKVISSIGTTETLCLYKNKVDNLNEECCFSWGCHVFPDSYYKLGGMPSGGDVIRWAIEEVLDEKSVDESYENFMEEAQNAPRGSNGIMFLPHLKGTVIPEINSKSRGGFWGLDINSKTSDICNSILEGLAFESRVLLEHSGHNEVDFIIAIGGGAKNSVWMQTKADILGVPIKVVANIDVVTYGAALMGGIGAEVIRNEDLISLKPNYDYTCVPNEENNIFYEELYNKVYKQLYDNQKQIINRINEVIK